jgi:hypothetical protein
MVQLKKQAKKEFRLYAKKNLPDPKKITRFEETQTLLQELHYLMHEFKVRFNFIPEEVHLRFKTYKDIQDRMVYDQFKKSCQQVLC